MHRCFNRKRCPFWTGDSEVRSQLNLGPGSPGTPKSLSWQQAKFSLDSTHPIVLTERPSVIKEEFIGESIAPVKRSVSVAPINIGEPALPRTFSWRREHFSVTEVLEKWKGVGDCTHGSGERYVRKHWYRIRTDTDVEMKIYFERQGRTRSKSRWRLYSLRKTEAERARS